MSARPEPLFPLFAGIETLPGIGAKTARAMASLAIANPRDLLLTLPAGGIDRTPVASIRDAPLPGVVTVPVTVVRHLPPPSPGRPYRVEVEDARTAFHVVYFRGAAEAHLRAWSESTRR